MVNQILQSELGFIPLRGDDIININYKNTSMIWGPSGPIGEFLAIFCPSFFKYIPVGEYAGQAKYWPWFWLIFPCYIILTPVCFLISLSTDYKHFKNDIIYLNNYFNIKILKKYELTQDGLKIYSDKIINKKIENIIKSHKKFIKN